MLLTQQFGISDLESLRDATSSISQNPNPSTSLNYLLKAEVITGLLNTLIIIITLTKFILPTVKTLDKLLKSSYTLLIKSYIKEVKYVEDILENILLLTKADRVCVGVFHNGDNWGSFHFLKMSIIYEATKPGIQSFKKRFQAVPIENILTEIKNITSTEFKVFTYSEDLSQGCKQHMDASGLSSIASRLISKGENEDNIIAVINCHKVTGNFSGVAFSEPDIEREFNRLCWALTRINESKALPD